MAGGRSTGGVKKDRATAGKGKGKFKQPYKLIKFDKQINLRTIRRKLKESQT